MISRRIQVARMLLEGKTYEQIKKKLKVGASTISQVELWLNNGFGGYKKMIEKYQQKHPQRSDFEKHGFPPLSPEWTRKKYPGYHILSNIFRGKIE